LRPKVGVTGRRHLGSASPLVTTGKIKMGKEAGRGWSGGANAMLCHGTRVTSAFLSYNGGLWDCQNSGRIYS